ncbi:receptor-type tyrosine-protein phosphatase eta [Pungitius pungitius]|uniref:receptor-type tyrosine-protein phosphatase eta n=1 Tax=Pungitius pungitius TaxID=134920 RepID=UPI002E0FF58B
MLLSYWTMSRIKFNYLQLFNYLLSSCIHCSHTEPEVVRNITVTDITTSSISLTWIEPKGNSSFYGVQWTDGNVSRSNNVTTTNITITNLTAGVQYEITVTAVTNEGRTEGQNTSVSQYTKPGEIRTPTVSTNTSSISLQWTSPPGEVFKYRLEWTSNGDMRNVCTHDNFAVLSELIPGTSYTISVIAVAGDNQTEGQAHRLTAVTKPEVVRNITVTDITTSSISLTWIEPKGNSSFYRVQWTDGNVSRSNNVTTTNITITNLTAGVQYEITVTAVTNEGRTEGQNTSVSQYTRPVKPENIMVTARGTNDLNISWTLRAGRVDHYLVTISGERLTYSNQTEATTFSFTDLNPGREFSIKVTAVAGFFNVTSNSSEFATVPTPPGALNISQGTNVLDLEWKTPALMEGAPLISYYITYQPEGGKVQNKSSSSNATRLTSLSSGTLHNITVETVGPQNLRSTPIRGSAFTLPNPVQNLSASPNSTTSIKVKWLAPQEAKSYYRYLVQTNNATGLLFKTTVTNTSTEVTNLQPGTRYDIRVTTIAGEGSQSTVESTFSYTRPKAVANLTVEDQNTTSVRLTWLRRTDHTPSYSYLVIALQSAAVVQNHSANTETDTFLNLTPGTLYTFDVFTVVEGVSSTAESTQSYTKPAAVSGVMTKGSTTTMTVSWIRAEGQVVSYAVSLFQDDHVVRNATGLSNSTTNEEFQNLTAGVLYCVEVVSKSGPFTNAASRVCNATFPNPPGPITVESQTVNSINFTWSFPEGMDQNQCNFSVFGLNSSSLTRNNWYELRHLESGSPYVLSVVTVCLYQSTAVTTSNYTRPYNVTMLRQTEITTNAVTLEWEQLENKSDYSYLVKTTNGSSNQSVVNEHKIIVTGLLSGTKYSFTVITETLDGTQAAPVTVSYFTRPYSTGRLRFEAVNTTAVRLAWDEPAEHKADYTYRVETTGCGSRNETLAGHVADISALTPGTNCTFCVFVRAADGIEGEARCASQYTEPEAVQPRLSSNGSNSSMLVSWGTPRGRVEHYKVELNSTSKVERTLDSTQTEFQFNNLSAGRLYSVVVTTLSGPFNASSDFITNATFPNPPGTIKVLKKTTGSFDIGWTEAPLMTGATFYYQLTNPSGHGEDKTTDTNHSFTGLLSGTSYNISVATVGAMDFKSATVQITVTTRPFSVKSLMTSTEEEHITVTWKNPDEHKENYSYNLGWHSSNYHILNVTTTENVLEIKNLVPGERYNISVTTKTSDGTESAPMWISNCTNASPVKDLACFGPNTPIAQVTVSWKKNKGLTSAFKVTVNFSEIVKSTSSCCNYTVSNLRHSTTYNLSVETQSCGLPSTPVSRTCSTGITNPPIPKDYEALVSVTNTEYNRFSIQINKLLLNNINGPIQNIGVLVTEQLPDDKDFTAYVGRTYQEWIEGATPGYMATVKTVTENSFSSRSEEEHLDIEIGDRSKWEGYINGALKARGKYHYAIVLFTSLTLEKSLVNGQLFSSTNFYAAVELPQDPALISIAVGVTLGIFCVLFIILIGFIIYWKRLSNKDSPDIQIFSMRAKVSMAVRVQDFEAYYKKQKADSSCGFAEEFEDLKLVGTAQSKIQAVTMENKPKNRYNNVLPYDSSRVKLSIIHGSPYEDYINANYMPGYNSRKEYIAAQGPLPATVREFWRMIWEKNVQTLVMLTRCNEQGRVKCEQYWDHGTKHFDNITVTTSSEIKLDDWTIRDFDVKNVKTAETRSVRHFHFTAWPDHGVPETTELLISFRHLVREHMDQYSRNSPTVVHCSAGVGRTGTFITIDRLIFQIEREDFVDVYGIVHDLRMHRTLMVQTEDQYVFLNQCALDIIRSRTGNNVDLIYQNSAAMSIYENIDPKTGYLCE